MLLVTLFLVIIFSVIYFEYITSIQFLTNYALTYIYALITYTFLY